MTTFAFFADAGLTVPLSPLAATVSTAGGSAQGVVFFGSPASGAALTREGGGDVTIELADSDPGGGIPASSVKLALSAGGLDSAVGGASLALGASVSSGAAGARAVYWRVTLGAGAAVTYSDLSLKVLAVLEA